MIKYLIAKIIRFVKHPFSFNPYCPLCGGCGEDGCCSAIHCLNEQKFHCEYGEIYKLDIIYAYRVHSELPESLYKLIDTKEYKEFCDNIWDEVYK